MTGMLSFDEAVAKTSDGKPHVLLGNGFSIGAHPVFSYGTLYEQAKQVNLPDHVTELFGWYGTTNFEQVMRQLAEARRFAEHYQLAGTGSGRDMAADYDLLKGALVGAIADTHPATPSEIGEGNLASSANFLKSFKKVFTTNYDLLLYWASASLDSFPFQDGFGRDRDTPSDYVVFRQTTTGTGLMCFLHGALHLTTVDGEVRKFVWNTTGIPLMEQIRATLEQGHYPLVVSEGTELDKRRRIESSSYLSWALRRFEGIRGTLFTYGWALSEQDGHLLQAIARNSGLRSLCVGVYGDPNSEPNRGLMATARELADRRKILHPEAKAGHKRRPYELSVSFFDAATAKVWGIE